MGDSSQMRSSYSSVSSPPTTPINTPPRRFSSPSTVLSNSGVTSSGRRGQSLTISDRFIPSRLSTNLDEAFDIMDNKDLSKDQNTKNDVSHENQITMNNLIRYELLGQQVSEYSLDSRLDGNLKSPGC